MGGTPRPSALAKLAEIEKAPRGLYSGVAGWMDAKGRAEFIVPIRCGRIQKNSLTLFAGAGIVEGSIPENEKVKQIGNCKPCLKSSLEVLIFQVE